MGLTDDEPTAKPEQINHPESATRLFENLQFGKNYDPTNPTD